MSPTASPVATAAAESVPQDRQRPTSTEDTGAVDQASGAADGVEQAGTSDPASRLVPGRVTIKRYGITIGPCTHLADERRRLAGLRFEHLQVEPQGATLGAEIGGVDLRDELSEPVIDEIRRALQEFKVIVFRDQPITSAQHVAFARRFGELEIHPFITGNDEHPELVRFEKGADTGGYENGWHHDVTWREVPSAGAILHAVRVPATGGDTLFSDMTAAYDGLDEDLKARIDDLHAIHDYMMAFGHQVPEGRKEEFRARYPKARHPVVCTHPHTGRKLIFVNAYFTSHIDGMDFDEGVELIRQLSSQAAVTEYQYRVRWAPHTVVFWDNRSVQHYAASDYYPDVRVMERASIVGARPT